MAQSPDFVVDDGTGVSLLSQLNTMMAALASSNSGTSAPAAPYPGMVWLDTSVSPAICRRRNAANNAWIALEPETIPAGNFWGNPGGAAAAPQAMTPAQARASLGYSQSLALPGYQIFPSGLILNWGAYSLGAAGGASQTVTFATSFTTTVLGTWIRVANAADQMIGTSSVGLTTMIVNKGISDVAARSGTYFAIGI